MRRLYWFQNDLRLADNPGLLAQRDADSLLLVYLMPVSRPWCNVTGIGKQRARFLHESLQSLINALEALGQQLLILEGSPELVIPDLVRDYSIDVVSTTRAPGYYERRTLNRLHRQLGPAFEVHRGNTLFAHESLPFSLQDMPAHFTPFKEAVAPVPFDNPHPEPADLPTPPAARFHRLPKSEVRPHIALPILGGTEAAHRRLAQYVFEERGIVSYQQTRNCLDPLEGSSTLSPWLANGTLSVRQVQMAINEFVQSHGESDSTLALSSELLWREFFYWRAIENDIDLFKLRPEAATKRLHKCTFEPRAFARWCHGSTDYPLVNACIRQLLATGWMSNRGRQIAASCLINELQLDWRYGAAFFEKHLIDYDVASNYGNWQYIAGVGADPRGGRHFDIAKQTRMHDPQRLFITKWDGDQPVQPTYVTDAADWPIS